ncbi:hypothetical protein EHM82_01010, partial [bacterium]
MSARFTRTDGSRSLFEHAGGCSDRDSGLDEITAGGLPAGRPTLICGSAGCGKTLFGLEF